MLFRREGCCSKGGQLQLWTCEPRQAPEMDAPWQPILGICRPKPRPARICTSNASLYKRETGAWSASLACAGSARTERGGCARAAASGGSPGAAARTHESNTLHVHPSAHKDEGQAHRQEPTCTPRGGSPAATSLPPSRPAELWAQAACTKELQPTVARLAPLGAAFGQRPHTPHDANRGGSGPCAPQAARAC